MPQRRDFIKKMTMAGAACCLPSLLFSKEKEERNLIWADMISLHYDRSDNIPVKYRNPEFESNDCDETWQWARQQRSFLRFDDAVWNTILNEMAAVGINMVLINVGNGIQYDSHPEISVANAWSHEKLKSELSKMRKMGLEPVPKLNFSTSHDLWLGKYHRMVSTDIYYDVCRDLIREVSALFDYPRFFHLGMDEEIPYYQRDHNYVVARQHDLWWGDLYFFFGEVEKNNVRPWVWSDYAWYQPDLYFRKMPRSVLQSNWYYGLNFDPTTLKDLDKANVKLYNDLEEQGYDQIPTGSNHDHPGNFESTVDYCRKVIDPSRLLGFMTAPWRPTLPSCLEKHREAIQQVGRAINKFKRE